MSAPSNRTGIHSALVAALLAVILLAGFGLGPRVFEFRAWPQPARDDKVEEVVARSAEEATEVPVVRVRRPERGRVREDALAARGRDARRRGGRTPELGARSRSGRGEASGGRGRGGDAGETAPPVRDVVIVPDAPAPAPDAPVSEPEEPTQLAELAEPQPQQPVLRPDAEGVPTAPLPEPREDDDVRLVALDADGLLEDVDRLVDGLLPGDREGGRHGRRHGRP